MSDERNPYQPPEAALSRSTVVGGQGRIVLVDALTEAWNAFLHSFPLWFVIGVLWFVTSVASFFTVLGIVFLIPVLFWGFIYAALEMFDGRGGIGDLFAGFRSYASSLLGMLVFFVLVTVFSFSLNLAVQMVAAAMDPLAQILFSLVAGFIPGMVICRLYFAWILMVERRLGPIEALGMSWVETQGQWGTLILMLAVSYALYFVGLIALVIGLIPTTALTGFMWIAAYRQLFGRVESSDLGGLV